jgi:multiple sugar transport system substrate-binding protein
MSASDERELTRGLVEGRISRREFVARALAAGVSLGTVGAILQACSGSAGGSGGNQQAAGGTPAAPGNGAAANTPAPQANQDTNAGSGEAVTLTFTFWGSTFEKQAMDAMVKKFEAANPNIKVDAQHIENSAYDTKMNTLIAANKQPDVAYMSEAMALKLAGQGKLLDVQQYFDQYPQLANRLPQAYYYYAPGKTIGTNTAVETIQLFYNRQLLEDAGVDTPPADATKAWSWDQFLEAAKRLTIDRSGKRASEPGFDPKQIKQFGITFPTWFGGWYPLVRSNGGSITNEDGTKYALNRPESVEVFQNLQDLMYKHRVAPTPTQQQANQATTTVQLQTKRVAMAIDGQWNLLDMAQTKLDYGIGVLPRFKDPKTIVLGAPTVIFKSTKNPDAAMKFYLYHNDPQVVDLYAQGLWMPLEQKYYEDPQFIAKWTKNEAHPAEYKSAVIDYVTKYSEPSPVYRLKGWDRIDPRLGPGLDPIWTGKQPAKQALDALEKTVQPLLKGLYPTK